MPAMLPARAWSVPASSTPPDDPKGTGHWRRGGVGGGGGGGGGGSGAFESLCFGPQTNEPPALPSFSLRDVMTSA